MSTSIEVRIFQILPVIEIQIAEKERTKASTTSSEKESSESNNTEDPRNPARVRRLLRRQLARGPTLLADVEATRQVAPKQEKVLQEGTQGKKSDDPRQA
jgi:hypothetical protein